jgi:hypothetical protein
MRAGISIAGRRSYAFQTQCAHRQDVHELGAMIDETFEGSKQHRLGLLPFRLRFHKAHLGSLGRDDDRLGIGRVVFPPLHERPDILWRNQLYLMAELHQFPSPVIRAATGLQSPRPQVIDPP